ncbi:MAG: tetratricopeptide repeat protein [Planctomycetes bacterium]|nr:tetratricopeptide repeat protein [Planctomycetota bacterium]
MTSRQVAEFMQRGNEALAAGKYQDALAAYDEAKRVRPESPEVAYNRGIALYRLGKYDDAQKALQDALKPDRPDMEAKVKYNLGRSAHEAAIAGRDKPEEAINSIGKAINFYKEAQTLNAKDDDPRKNLEQAERLRAYFEKKLKEKQEEKKNPSSQPTSQPKDEPSSQPDEKQQPSSQPSSQPDQEKGDEGDKGDEEQQQDQKGDQKKDQKGDKQKKGDQQGQSDSQEGEQKEGEEPKPDEQNAEQSKQEEVEPMLQEARDAEKARREAKRAKMMRLRGKIPVSKDW